MHPLWQTNMPIILGLKTLVIVSIIVGNREITSKALSVKKNRPSQLQVHTFFNCNPTNKRHSVCCDSLAMTKPSTETQHYHQLPQKRKATSEISSSNIQNRTAMVNSAPLYITVGPQCCGKSTILKTMEGGMIKDICLDDQPDVYVSVPTNVFLDCITGKSTTDVESLELLQRIYQGKTIQERIQNDNNELGLILQRWNGDMSQEEFQRAIQALYTSREFPLQVAEQLVEVVEKYVKRKTADSKPISLPKTVGIFILESLFLPQPDTQQSAIQRAYQELEMTPKHIPIAWGNTNSKSRDYSQALEIAFQTGRRVRFVLCHPFLDSGEKVAVATESPLITLPWIDLLDLLKRNLKRLKTTGRYIPAFAIADCCKRVESLVTINEAEGSHTVEQRLVSLAQPSFVNGYEGKQQRRNPTFKYALTSDNLIQKIFPPSQQRQPNRSNRQTDYR
jgi:energy-coupling factor transporter ATP-binding protein EcfA2